MGLPLVSCRVGPIMLLMLVVSPRSHEATAPSRGSRPPTVRRAAVPARGVSGIEAIDEIARHRRVLRTLRRTDLMRHGRALTAVTPPWDQ